jgi:hypothetical protein
VRCDHMRCWGLRSEVADMEEVELEVELEVA